MHELEMENGRVQDATTVVLYCPECDAAPPDGDNVYCACCGTELVFVRP